MTPIEETKHIISEVKSFLETTPWKNIFLPRLEILNEKASMPCELAVAGRVKAGKSSFLNALLGEDLAMVGTTETTATINFFKYGEPKDSEHPVLVVWEDGTEEWQTKAFLDSLQGNSIEVIERASKIDHLEYYLQKEILKNITLVDTPGTNAIVDEHNKRTEDYFMEHLRKKHHEQSIHLKERADAVIIVVGHVPSASNKEIIVNFTDNTTAFNAIGIMSKIDNENLTIEEWSARCSNYSDMMKHYLNKILPASASLYSAFKNLEKNNRLSWMQEKVRLITNESHFERLFSNSTKYHSVQPADTSLFSKYGINEALRKELISEIADFPVFYKIAKELYYNSLDDAKKHIVEYSGMEKVWDTINKQFLERSRIIRCASILKEVHAILTEINERWLYDMRIESFNRNAYLEIITAYNILQGMYYSGDEKDRDICSRYRVIIPFYHMNDVKYRCDAFKRFVNRNICSQEETKTIEDNLNSLLSRVECIRRKYTQTDKNAEALMVLEHNPCLFTKDEVKEIELLLGQHIGKDIKNLNLSIKDRLLYWRGKKHFYIGNSDASKVIDAVIYNYNILNRNNEGF